MMNTDALSKTNILRLKDGDHNAYEQIYNKLYPHLFYFVREYIADEETVRNILQDTFLTLWEKRTILLEDINLTAWLYTVTKNKALKHLRHKEYINKFSSEKNQTFSEDKLNAFALERLYPMENELLIKLVIGLCSKEEKYEILQLLEKDENLRKEFADFKNVYALSKSFSEINSEKFASEFITIRKKINRIRLRSMLRYASILFLAFGMGGVLFYLAVPRQKLSAELKEGIKTTFIIPLGQTAEVMLPDSSRVLLNSGSTLSYFSDFTPSNRRVELNGEAYFDIKKDPHHPFIVTTSSVNIKVTGTSFNVEAYNDKLQEVNTTLISGKVEIESLANKKLADLTPGMMASYKKTKQVLFLSKVDIDLYTSWKKGLLIFKDIQLQTITQKMERWYNVEIIYENPRLKNLRYSGAILKNKPIDQILEVMKITSNIQYKINFRSNKPSIIYLK